MATTMIGWLLAVGAVLVVASIVLRVHSNGKYEVKTIDLTLLIIPLLLVAIATGKIKGVDVFGVRADLSDLWAQAAQAKIEKQVAVAAPTTVQDAVQVLELAAKGGVGELHRLIDRKVKVLEFKLGGGGYSGPAIKTYLDALTGSSHLQYIVVDKPDGRLFGMYKAGDLVAYLRLAGNEGYESLRRLLNSGDKSAQEQLSKLPGFIASDLAVTKTTSKRDALASMERLNIDSLPVVNEAQVFVGTVERATLTTSLFLP